MTKKILQFVSSHRIGVTDQLVSQAQASLTVGDAAWVFVSGEKEQHQGLGETLRRAGGVHAIIPGLDDHGEFARLSRALAELIRLHRPNYVSVHTNWQLALAVHAAARLRPRPRLVYTIHGFRHNHPVRSVVARLVIGAALWLFAWRVIAPSRFLAGRFRAIRKQIRVIPLGESELFFREVPPPDFSVPLRFVFPGEFRSGKNQDLLIRAFAKFVSASSDRGAELVLPGAGAQLEGCRSLARHLGLEGRVIFPGFLNREEMVGWYLRSQCAVVPTNVETFGHCIVEPLVLGRVVLTRRVGVAEDVIVHGENGFLFDTEDELVEMLLSLDGRRDELAAIAKRALACRDRFGWETIMRQHLEEVFT
ncbi:MAG: glycosyltransferase family 4 protein [Acidobacteria bacterium]|nr:glycosyltransferase family 4 protein [Acidobacteriota bacterium]